MRWINLIFLVSSLTSCSEWENDLVAYGGSSHSYQEQVDTLDSAIVDSLGQLYNMGFDLWSKDGKNDVCYGADATEREKTVWASANASTAMFNKLTCIPEDVFMAAEGEGKRALKLQTQLINAIITKKLAAGCIFTGQMGNISLSNLSATLNWGIPFTLRPAALEGYACYKPVAIDVAKTPYENRKGAIDSGHIFVLLTDWDEQFTVDPATSSFVDTDDNPNIIGYGKVVFDHTMADYEKFTLDIEYRSDRTPRYLVIVASSSALGDYFTGGNGSTLYLDELRFLY